MKLRCRVSMKGSVPAFLVEVWNFPSLLRGRWCSILPRVCDGETRVYREDERTTTEGSWRTRVRGVWMDNSKTPEDKGQRKLNEFYRSETSKQSPE